MKVSEHFGLNKTQPELDFIDVNTSTDTPLFIDPFFLSNRIDAWSQNATRSIQSFFQHLLDLLSQQSIDEARELFSHLGEPNETCLGLSKGRPRGRGVGPENTEKIFNRLVRSRANRSGLIEDMEDNLIFVDGVGKDKLSDMTTNIIRKNLIEYTQSQALMWGIPLQPGVSSGDIWDIENLRWDNIHTDMLVIEGRKHLLVPKGIVSYCEDYTPQKYHQHFVLNFLQNEQLRLRTALVTRKYRKDGSYSEEVYKQDVKDILSPGNKEDLREFTRRNPRIFSQFKEDTKSKVKSLIDEQIVPISIEEVIDHLIESLQSLPTGKNSATDYEHLIAGILELLFYPDLMCPAKQVRIHGGKKKIDITFDNAAKEGSFFEFHKIHDIPCQYIMIECKNYSEDPANPELDQLIGRFSPNRGKVGFLVCRNVSNLTTLMQRCNNSYRDNHGLIIPLVDNDLIAGLKQRKERIIRPLDSVLRERGRFIQMN